MTKRFAVGALLGALMVVASGCTSGECVDQFDCNNQKGNAGAGKAWVCEANKCVVHDAPATPTDAGTTEDAGTPADAGATPDAGSGSMTIDEGQACVTTESCKAGLYCGGGLSQCTPLSIAVTAESTALPQPGQSAPTSAVFVPFNKAVAPTKLESDATFITRYPRWNPAGNTVAYVKAPTDNSSASLVSRTLGLTVGAETVLTTGASAGNTKDFAYMEWEPSPTIAWCNTTGTTTSGIWTYTGPGPATSVLPTGVFPAWAADGSTFAYSVNNGGITKKSPASTAAVGASRTAEQPQFNKANGILLYLDANGQTEATLGNEPLRSLYTIDSATASGTGTLIAEAKLETTVSNGEVKSFIANHTWSPKGTHVAYVKAYYFKPTDGSPSSLCDATKCGGLQGNVVFVQRVDATGNPDGAAIEFAREATLPSFSPEGYYLAYLTGAQLRVQQIDPAATDPAQVKVGTEIVHNWSSSAQLRVVSRNGDDSRPRWQPR